jgi:hypothetical protein
MGSLRSSGEVAESLLAEVEFGELRLATWLQSPDGQLVRMVVEGMLPPLSRVEVDLMVEGVMAAADAKQRNDQRRAAVVTCAVALGLGLAIILSIRPNGGPRLARR